MALIMPGLTKLIAVVGIINANYTAARALSARSLLVWACRISLERVQMMLAMRLTTDGQSYKFTIPLLGELSGPESTAS